MPKSIEKPIPDVAFLGHGQFITGVPAADMTRSEWELLPAELRTQALACGLYKINYEVNDAIHA